MGTGDEPTDELDGPEQGPAVAVADPPLIAAGRRLGERYRLERPLGHGGMASVWLATDERLDRQVAVKILSETLAHDDEYLGRFRREAHVVAGLQHPNLVSVYDFGAGERPYLVMEYIPGGDLAERVDAGDVPDPESLARELLSALRHIHSAGVLHRDIKPQNVLIDATGHARLSDFGIAQPRDATALTKTGQVIGTESYIAPEVKQGARASERADLYALGVVLADVAREGAGAGLWELDRPPARSRPRAPATLGRRRSRHPRPPATPRSRHRDAAVCRPPANRAHRRGPARHRSLRADADRRPGADPAAEDRARAAGGGGDPGRAGDRIGARIGRRRVLGRRRARAGRELSGRPCRGRCRRRAGRVRGARDAGARDPAPADDSSSDGAAVAGPSEDGLALNTEGKELIDAATPRARSRSWSAR